MDYVIVVLEDMSLDLTKIKDAVDEVISYSQNIPKPLETDDLINTWYNNKKRFIDAMDGKLIWECPNCKNRDQNKLNVARRTCGYIGVNFWNFGRTEEIAERKLHL